MKVFYSLLLTFSFFQNINSCMAKSDQEFSWRRKTKKRMVAAFGGKCCICKKKYPQELFEFHHLNPAEKDFGVGSVKSISWDRLVIELRKCVMVCANCHRLVEYGHMTIPKEITLFNESFTKWRKNVL